MTSRDDSHEFDLPEGLALPLDDAAGPAPRLSAGGVDALLTGALDAWQAEAPPESAPAPAPLPPRAIRWPWAAAAAFFFFFAGGAAAYYVFVESGDGAPAPAEGADMRGARGPAHIGAASTPVDEVSAHRSDGVGGGEAGDPTPDVDGHPANPADDGTVPAELGAQDAAPAIQAGADDAVEGRGVSAGAPAGEPGRRSAPAAPSADALLREANQLRGQGRYADAASRYRQAMRAGRGTRVASVARVAAANLELERLGRPAAAAGLYRSASRGGGALASEALWGLARAERRLGHTARERAALERLVRAHGTSPYASVAARRLEALAARAPASVTE